jgi:hypothetical protein
VADLTWHIMRAWTAMRNNGEKQTHHGRKTARVANTLDDAKKFKLWNTLRSLEAELQAEGPTLAAVADRAGRELGFPVTSANVRSAVEAGVVHWERPRANQAPRGKLWDEIQKLVTCHREHVERLERDIRFLYRELNIPYPEQTAMAPTSRSET